MLKKKNFKSRIFIIHTGIVVINCLNYKNSIDYIIHDKLIKKSPPKFYICLKPCIKLFTNTKCRLYLFVSKIIKTIEMNKFESIL